VLSADSDRASLAAALPSGIRRRRDDAVGIGGHEATCAVPPEDISTNIGGEL
jgi:hypothetical protein